MLPQPPFSAQVVGMWSFVCIRLILARYSHQKLFINNFMKQVVAKKSVQPPSRLTETVENALKDVAANNSQLTVDLKAVRLVKATTIDALPNKPIIIYVHISSLKSIQKLGKKLIFELEKKLKTLVFITCKRTIQSRWIKPHRSQKRPRNRTLTAVHDALLQELCLPCNIIGRRLRVRVDGTTVHRIILDNIDYAFFQDRVKVVEEIYKRLTCKTIEIELAEDPVYYKLSRKGEK